MENWLRCNKCYRYCMGSSKEFFATQCEHVFCSVCVGEARQQCPECKAVGPQTIILQKPMPQQMSHYFSPVSVLVDQTLDATRFQRKQFMIALRRARQIDEDYDKLKKLHAQSLEAVKTLIATRDVLGGNLEKLRISDAQSVAVNENFSRSSISRRREQCKPAPQHVSARSHSQHRDSRIVPDTSNSHYSQRIKRELEYASTSAQPRIAASQQTARGNPNLSRPSSSHREQQLIKRASECDQPSSRQRSRVDAVPRHRMVTESSSVPVTSTPICYRPSTHHRESQNRRAVEYTQNPSHQSQLNTQISNYRCIPNQQYNLCQYPNRAIVSAAHSSLEANPQEEVHRVAMNRRIPRSMEISSNTFLPGPYGATGRNTPNAPAHFSNYNSWNMRSD